MCIRDSHGSPEDSPAKTGRSPANDCPPATGTETSGAPVWCPAATHPATCCCAGAQQERQSTDCSAGTSHSTQSCSQTAQRSPDSPWAR